MTKPQRVQRQRAKGWRMPEGAVYVGRPTWFCNPFEPSDFWDAGYSGASCVAVAECVKAYREWLTGVPWTLVWNPRLTDWALACREGRVDALDRLCGKDLACWCPLDQPCHADVLLELANA